MKFFMIYILIKCLFQFGNSKEEPPNPLDDLKCNEYYVKIYNTATRSIEYTCQEFIPWDDEDNFIFCTDRKKTPYVMVYNSVNGSASITFYKICCQTKECLEQYPFDPFHRFGENIPHIRRSPLFFQTDAGHLDLVVQYLVVSVFFVGTSYFAFHITYVRHRVITRWNDEQEHVDPRLLDMAEKPQMHIVKIGHKYGDGIPITGQHSFLDYCRILASYAARDAHVRESQLIDPLVISARILQHELRTCRDIREPGAIGWRFRHDLHNPNPRFVKIGGKWIFITNKMIEDRFVEKQLMIDQRKAIQRYTKALKMYPKLRAKERYETKYMTRFDISDVKYLHNIGEKSMDMHMIFFDSVGLGHELYQVDRPYGNVQHNNVFEKMFFHGPYFYPWYPDELIDLFGKAKELFIVDPICMTLRLPIVIIGEIRGRYADLHRWLQITGVPYRRKLLFVGGYVERGGGNTFQEYSVECLSFIAALKLAYPKFVFMLRGPGEVTFSFSPRFGVHMDDAVLLAARQMCNCLPLTALISDDYLVVPSGIAPYMIEDLYGISHIERPLRPESLPNPIRWLLFGQPDSQYTHYEHYKDTKTFRYGLRAVEVLCRKWDLKAIIRSRNHLPINPMFLCDRKFISISSTPTKLSAGVAMLIDETLGWVFFKLRYQTENLKFAPNSNEPLFDWIDETIIEKSKSKSKKKEKKIKSMKRVSKKSIKKSMKKSKKASIRKSKKSSKKISKKASKKTVKKA